MDRVDGNPNGIIGRVWCCRLDMVEKERRCELNPTTVWIEWMRGELTP
jgi:hypothetical protein